MIGVLGNVLFRVSDSRVLTIRNMKQEISASWETMDRIGLKPLTEYSGPNLQTISFEITLDASLGVKPRMMLQTLERMAEGSEAYDLVLGRRLIGKNKWVITKCSAAYDVILRGGDIYKATVSLNLQEYV